MDIRVKKLLKDIGFFTIASFSVKIISFLALPLYTSILTTEEYANIDLLTLLTQLAIPIFSLSISDAVIRFSMDKNYNNKEIFTIGNMLTIISTLLIGLLVPILSFFSETKGKEIFFILLYFTSLLSTVISYYLRALNKLTTVVVNSIGSTALNLILCYVLISKFDLGEIGYYWAMIISSFAGCIYMIFATKLWEYLFVSKNSGAAFVEMAKFSVPLIPNSICWWANSSINRFILNEHVDKNELGLYSASNKIPNLLSLITSTFQQAWVLSSIETYEKAKGDQGEENISFFSDVFKVYDFLVLLGSFILICASKLIASFLLKMEFFGGWIFIPLLVIAFYFNALNSFVGSIMTAIKQTKGLFITTLIGAIINVAGACFLIPLLGGQGAALSSVLGYFSMWIMRWIMLKKHIKFKVKIVQSIINYLILFMVFFAMVYLKNIFWVIGVIILATIMLLVNSRQTIKYLFQTIKNSNGNCIKKG